jgi:hypothetical protein
VYEYTSLRIGSRYAIKSAFPYLSKTRASVVGKERPMSYVASTNVEIAKDFTPHLIDLEEEGAKLKFEREVAVV